MAKSRVINTKFWSDNWVSNLDPIEKLLFLYLLTNERTEICGIYELPLKYMSIETGIEKDMIEKILRRFEEDKKIRYFDGWVCIVNFVKHQAINPSVKQGIERCFSSIPDKIKQSVYSLYTGTPQEGLLNLTKLNLTKPNLSDMSVSETDAFNQFWHTYPKKELKKKSEQIWKTKKLYLHLEEILSFILQAKLSDRWKQGFIKQPPAFLNGECWNDDLSAYQNKNAPKLSNRLPAPEGKYKNL